MSRELTPQEIAERSLIKTYRKSIWNPFIAAVKRYELGVSRAIKSPCAFPAARILLCWQS